MAVVHLTKPFSRQEEQLLEQYYQLRVEAFAREFGGSALYKAGPNAIDALEDTAYYMLTDANGDVLAGMRLHMHPPHSDRKMWFEEHYPALQLDRFFPHTDLGQQSYAERGGVVAKEGHGTAFYGNELLTECLKRIPDDYPELAFTVGNTNPLSFKSLMIASMRAETPVWYVRDQQAHDDAFDVDLRLVFAPVGKKGLDLLNDNIGPVHGDARSYSHEEWKR